MSEWVDLFLKYHFAVTATYKPVWVTLLFFVFNLSVSGVVSLQYFRGSSSTWLLARQDYWLIKNSLLWKFP